MFFEVFLQNKELLEVLSLLAIILGVPAGIIQFYRTSRREQLDREYGTYNALDEKYLDFLQLCFENPRLDVFDIPDFNPRTLTDLERKRELIAFTMLISLFERAFLMYYDQSSAIKRRQWSGWLDYMKLYATRKNFQVAWAICSDQFDTEFLEFMSRIVYAGQDADADSSTDSHPT